MPLLKNKTVRVGIFGGMGAIAGSAFYYKLTLAFQGLPEELQPMVFLLSDPTVPRRDRSLEEALNGRDPVEFIQKILQGLAFFKRENVDFVVVPCNTFHYFREMFQRVSGVRILDMIDIVCSHALKNQPKLEKIGLLSTEATAKSGIYRKVFSEKNVEVILPSYDEQRKINFIIEQVKIGLAANGATCVALSEVIHGMMARGINTIILGCTELPEVPLQSPHSCLLIDTTKALVEGTVDEAGCLKTIIPDVKIQSKL